MTAVARLDLPRGPRWYTPRRSRPPTARASVRSPSPTQVEPETGSVRRRPGDTGSVAPAGKLAPLSKRGAGRWQEDPGDAALFAGVGPVSAALFTDLTGDGWPELVLAIDGGPIRVYRNERGRLVEATERFGLNRLLGNWNGIASGDFDGDGRLDLVATNWGRNLTYEASVEEPLYLYVGRFGPSQSLDVIPATRDSSLGEITPIESFARLSRVLPTIRRQVPTYRAFATASIQQLLGPAAGGAHRLEINTLNHLVLLNRGDHFEPHPLPEEAQLAPGFGAVVADFDGDGREDLFLAQNFSQTELGTPRYDAGRGLLLLGDGKGSFVPMQGQYSGIAIPGDQRGAAAADFDQDGRVDLVVAQNAAEARLYRNRAAAPGIRIRLVGDKENPDGVGATVRVRYPDGEGPIREIQAGSGYWSSDGMPVLGLRGAPLSVLVRWRKGETIEVPVNGPGAVEVKGASLGPGLCPTDTEPIRVRVGMLPFKISQCSLTRYVTMVCQLGSGARFVTLLSSILR